MPEPRLQLSYRIFRGVWEGWEELFKEAAAFANNLGPERLVSISHSEDQNDGVVAVWYWAEADSPDTAPAGIVPGK